jgi:transcriptional regulator with XRE-family HTH domain
MNNFKIKSGYGIYITGKRVEKGLTRRTLSEETGIPAVKLSNIECEKTNGFSLHDFRLYLKALGIPSNEVFYD